jgi:hypothetical protein
MSSAMKRVPSFGRKPKRESSAASAESASCEEGSSRQSDAGAERSTEKPSSAGSRLGRIARSASFGRAKGKRPGSGTETGSSSSQSSPDSSDAASPGLALPPGKIMSAPSTRGLGSLHGFLLKKHTRDKTVSYQWAKRYFLVDDALGTLCYSKGVTRKPSVVLPLINITSVRSRPQAHVDRVPLRRANRSTTSCAQDCTVARCRPYRDGQAMPRARRQSGSVEYPLG